MAENSLEYPALDRLQLFNGIINVAGFRMVSGLFFKPPFPWIRMTLFRNVEWMI